MKKSLIFKILYLFLILIVVAGASVFATNTYLASQVSYGSTNVEDALNGLFTLKENTYNYSTDEQIIGKWIDNKPIYRKIINATTPNTNGKVDSIKIPDNISVDTYINIRGLIVASNETTTYIINGSTLSFNSTSGKSTEIIQYINIWGRNHNGNLPNTIAIQAYHAQWLNRPIKLIIEYTKTTD